MPPIPIYADAPITPSKTTTAAKAEGVTPRTAIANSEEQQQPRPTPTTTTATTTVDPTAPPPPQPGARPTPPTAAPTASSNGPPPPQPGAAPKPPGHVPTVTATITETVTRQLPPTGMPSQFDIALPSSNGGATRSTTAAVPPPPKASEQQQQLQQQQPTMLGPGTLHLGQAPPPPPPSSSSSFAPAPQPQPSPFEPGQTGPNHHHSASTSSRHSLEHPPGYAQNPYIDGSAAQRNALLDAAEAEKAERNSVGAWIGAAAEKLRGVEEGVWRVVGGK